MKINFYTNFLYAPSGDGGMNMFYGASNLIFQRAEELRNTMTPAEEILWKELHINEWKLKFRRHITDKLRVGGDGRKLDDYVVIDPRSAQ